LNVPQIFLCHSSTDKQIVRQLYGRLLADGFRPWLDAEDLIPGQDWEHEIEKAITNSDIVIVCLSRESTGKTGYVQKEIRLALDAADRRPEGSIFLIPSRLEPCNLPERLRRWQCVNLYENDGYHKLRRAVVAAESSPEDESLEPTARKFAALSQQEAVTATVRFDGLYIGSEQGYFQYIRFFPDGKVCTASSTGNVRQVAEWLRPDGGEYAAEGEYVIYGPRISFRSKSSFGTVEYRGTINSDSTELRLYSQSFINGYESFKVFRFESIDE